MASLLVTACGSYLSSILDTTQESSMEDTSIGIADTIYPTQNICSRTKHILRIRDNVNNAID